MRTPKKDVESLITAATEHGEQSFAVDMECGDLQQLLRAAWRVMDKEAREKLITSDEAVSVLEWLAQ